MGVSLRTFALVCVCLPPISAASPADELRRKGLECARQKNWACAIENYTRAIGIQPDADAYYNLGLAYKYAGKPEQAATQFESALKLKPKWAEAEYALGASLYALGRNRAQGRSRTLSVTARRRAYVRKQAGRAS